MMRPRRTKITTNNKEIYDKFNMLHFSREVLLKGVKTRQIDMILKRINKTGKILDYEIINGDYILIKKKKNFDFNIYLK